MFRIGCVVSIGAAKSGKVRPQPSKKRPFEFCCCARSWLERIKAKAKVTILVDLKVNLLRVVASTRHVAAMPPNKVITSRRLMGSPQAGRLKSTTALARRREYAYAHSTTGCCFA